MNPDRDELLRLADELDNGAMPQRASITNISTTVTKVIEQIRLIAAREAAPAAAVGVPEQIIEALRLADQFFGGQDGDWEWSDGEPFPASKIRAALLAASPAPPATTAPQGKENLPAEMLVRPTGDPGTFGSWQDNGFACGWNAYREAMLKEVRDYAEWISVPVCRTCEGVGAIEIQHTVARCCGRQLANGDCCGSPEPELDIQVADCPDCIQAHR